MINIIISHVAYIAVAYLSNIQILNCTELGQPLDVFKISYTCYQF